MFRTLASVLIVAGSLAAAPRPADAERSTAELPKLGKFVVVYYAADNKHQIIPIESPETRAVGNKTFLTGVATKIAGATMLGAGRPVWVNLDNVQMVYHYDSLEEMTKDIQDNLPGR